MVKKIKEIRFVPRVRTNAPDYNYKGVFVVMYRNLPLRAGKVIVSNKAVTHRFIFPVMGTKIVGYGASNKPGYIDVFVVYTDGSMVKRTLWTTKKRRKYVLLLNVGKR